MRAIRIVCVLLLGILSLENSHASCIHGENTSIPISTPTSAFNVLADGTVRAPGTRLMWMRCPVGQTLSNSVCTGTSSIFTWADALNAAKAQTFAGHNDWRLPNVKELLSIMEDRCYLPSLNADLFPISDFFIVWSSTPSAVNLSGTFDEAWTVDGNGYMVQWTKYQTLNVLLVRDAP
jgi:hypothetical protein